MTGTTLAVALAALVALGGGATLVAADGTLDDDLARLSGVAGGAGAERSDDDHDDGHDDDRADDRDHADGRDDDGDHDDEDDDEDGDDDEDDDA